MPSDLTLPPERTGIGVILFGLDCLATAVVLDGLLSANVDVRLLCLPGRRSAPVLKTGARRTFPMSTPPGDRRSPAEIAHASGLDVWRLGDLRSSEVEAALVDIEADLVVVACYHQRLPASLYASRRYGGINVHPSLLPDKRGPDPLFWVFRRADREAGSTVHRLTSSFDSGAILAQERLDIPDGITENELEARLARLGASQVAAIVQAMTENCVSETKQHDEAASWAPHPDGADFKLDRQCSARDAFNFVRGVQHRGYPVAIDYDGATKSVAIAHCYSGGETRPRDIPNGATAIPFATGWLVATFED